MIETITWNWKLVVAADFEKMLNERLRGRHFNKIELYESGNSLVVVTHSADVQAGSAQQAKVFGPGELDDIVGRINEVDGEASGKVIAVAPMSGSRRFVGTIIFAPKVEEAASGTESQGQDQKANATGAKRRRTRGNEPTN